MKDEILEAILNVGRDNTLSRLLTEGQQDIKKYMEATEAELTGFTEATKKAKKALEDHIQKSENTAKSDEAMYQTYNKKFEELTKSGGDLETAFKKLIEIMVKDGATQKVEQDRLKERLELEIKLVKAAKDELEVRKKEDKERALLERVKRTAHTNVSSIFDSLGMKFEGNPTDMNAIYTGLKLMKDGQVAQGQRLLAFYAEKMGEAYSNMVEPLNVGLTVLSQMKTQMFNVFVLADQITADFLKATGATKEFSDTIINAWDHTRGFNLSLKDMSDSVFNLMNNYRSFTLLSKESREEATVFNSLVTRLGVSSETSTKLFGYFADTLQLGTTGAITAYSDLLGLVKTTGETLAKVTDDFSASLPVLQRYGSQAKAVFKEVFATAKALRMETSELLEVTSHFDTYEDAATSVGKLNAILGGPYLNAVQMMQQNEAQRIVTLNAAFKATGKSWEQLDKYGQLAIATAAGITDMTLATKVFTGSTADASRMMRQASLDQEELAEKNKRATALAESFKNVLMQMGAVMKPLIDFAHLVVGAIASLGDAFGSIAAPLRILAVPVLFLATSVFLSFGKVLSSFSTKLVGKIIPALGWFVKAGKGIAPIMKVAAAATALEGTAAAASTVTTGALGGSMTITGGAALKSTVTVAGFAGAEGAAGVAAGVATPPVAALAAAEGATGVAAGVATPALGAFGAVLAGISAFAPALITALALIAGGILLIGGAIAAVNGMWRAFTESPSEELEDLVNTVHGAGSGIGREMEGIGSGLSQLIGAFNSNVKPESVEMFTDLLDVLADKSSKFTNSFAGGILSSYASLLSAVGDFNMTPTKITDISKFTENLVTLTNSTGNTENTTKLLESLTKLSKTINDKNEKEQQIGVKVYIDGEEMKANLVKYTTNYMSDRLDNKSGGQ